MKKSSKQLAFVIIALSNLFFSASEPRVVAYTSSSSSSSSPSSFPSNPTTFPSSPTQSSKTPPKTSPKTNPATPTPPTEEAPINRGGPYIPPKPVVKPGPIFMEPGVLFIKNDQYQGSDYLGRLPTSFPIVAEIIKSEKETFNLTEGEVINFIRKQFAGKNLVLNETRNQPETPFLRVIVLLQSIDDRGYAAAIRLSLFETVKIERAVLQEGMTFQAITWEREGLVVTPKDAAKDSIGKGLESLATDFVARYGAFNTGEPEKQEVERAQLK